LLHTEGEADFLLGDLEMARQENASDFLFIPVAEAKVEQIHFWIKLGDKVPFYNSLQTINLMSNQTTV